MSSDERAEATELLDDAAARDSHEFGDAETGDAETGDPESGDAESGEELAQPAPDPCAIERWQERVVRWQLAALVGIPALVFANTLSSTYHLDDIYRVKQNVALERFWPPTRFFTDVRTGSTLSTIAEYRPMMPLTHSIDLHIADALGLDRLSMYHLTNVAIHVASALLVYVLLLQLMTRWDPSVSRRLGKDTANAAFVAALIFAVHPIAGSAVNYIVGRDLLLMTFFLLAAMVVYLHMRQRDRDTVAGWLGFVVLVWLAILSKQEAIVAFGLVFLFELVLARTRLAGFALWRRTALAALPTIAYFVLRATWITQRNPDDELRVISGTEYPFTMARAHVYYYGRNFIYPFRMRALALFEPADTLADAGVLVGLACIAGTVWVAWRFRNRMPLLTFAILAYWLTFALTSSIFPFRFLVTDYRQYVPLVMLSLGVVLLLTMIENRRLAAAIACVFVAYAAIASIAVNAHWKTEESFWAQSVRYGARSIAHVNYALAVGGRDPALAEQHYFEALRQEPTNIYASINLGMLWVGHGKVDDGVEQLRGAAARNPDSALALYWLSKGLEAAGLTEERITAATRAASLDPGIDYQYEAGSALHLVGDTEGSIPYLERVVAVREDHELALFMLAFAHGQRGQIDQAIDEYRRYLEFHPTHAQSHFNLGHALLGQGLAVEAAAEFHTVLELQPDYAAAHFQLAKAYRALGDEAAAAEHDALFAAG